MEPAHNVELRADRHGHEHVVFAFPYRAEIVDAVRAIPGRRFDWDAKEWWAPQADSTAPYVKGVLERFPSLLVADEVHTWLAEAVTGWVGRVGAARLDGRGAFVLETISGELPDELEWAERGGRAWVPFSQAAAETLLELRGARLDKRALRCAMRLQVGQEPAGATLSLVDSVGEPRFTLDVNWDPDTIPAFLTLPACEAHGRSLPLDPYLIEPLEHYLRTYGVEVGGAAQERLDTLRAEHDAAIGDVRRSRAHDAPPRGGRGAAGRRAAPVPARGRRVRAAGRGGRSSPTSRASARPCRRSPRSRRTTRGPRSSICPASLKLNWQREAERWLPHRSVDGRLGHGGRRAPTADLTIVNYDIVHAHRVRLALRKPKALVLDESHYVKNPRAKRTQAVRRLADALPPDALRLALTGTPVMNHAEELIAQLRIIGRLEDFGSGARFARRFQGIGAEERIHWHLRRSCFVRRAKADVLPQLPAKRQVAGARRARQRARVPARRAGRDRLAARAAARPARARPQGRRGAARRAPRAAQRAAPPRLARQGRRGPGVDRGLPRVRRAARRLRRPPRDAGAARRALPRRAAPARPRLDHGARGRGPAPSRPASRSCWSARPASPARASRSRAPPTSPSSTSSGPRRCTTRPRTAATGSASTTR